MKSTMVLSIVLALVVLLPFARAGLYRPTARLKLRPLRRLAAEEHEALPPGTGGAGGGPGKDGQDGAPGAEAPTRAKGCSCRSRPGKGGSKDEGGGGGGGGGTGSSNNGTSECHCGAHGGGGGGRGGGGRESGSGDGGGGGGGGGDGGGGAIDGGYDYGDYGWAGGWNAQTGILRGHRRRI